MAERCCCWSLKVEGRIGIELVLCFHPVPEVQYIELQGIANWLRANRMAVNVSKTKFILFHTRGKKINEDDLKIVLNMNEIGKIEDPQLIFPLERIHS